jgi:transcriptional regulator with XRE-family HTH domain
VLTDSEKNAAHRLRECVASYPDRTGKPITQNKLAAMLGMSQPAVNQYLQGTVALNVKSTLRFAELLRVDPSYIFPELEAYFSMAKHASKVKKEAVFTKDGRLVKPKFDEELEWTAPVPNAKAILMEKDLGPSCPAGTMIIYDSDRTLNVFEVLANPGYWYVAVNVKGKRYPLYPCRVSMGDKTLRFIEDDIVVVDMNLADDMGKLPNAVAVHPVIGKMCLTGLV